jgi:hypothetical protein
VRPDVLTIAVAATVDGQGASGAIRILREAAYELVRQIDALAAGAELIAQRLHLGGGSADKSDKRAREGVQLDGILQVPLAASLDFWARADLAARTVEALGSAATQLRKQRPAVLLAWREPVARVADEEAHRAALIERHAAQLRPATSTATGQAGTTVAEVVQIPVSLVEVRLTLGWGRAVR